MNARLYDPWTARFLSPDPYVQLPDFTQSFNRYSYCLNNPLKLVDLTGKNVWLMDKDCNSILLAYSDSEWTVQMPEVEVTPKPSDNDFPSTFAEWSSIISFAGGAKTTYSAELQYSTTFKIWTGLNGKQCYGLSGSGPNQHTGSRSLAKIKANKIRKLARNFIALSISARLLDYRSSIISNPELGPNMRKYLHEKLVLRSAIDLMGLSGNSILAFFSLGYNLGDFLQNSVGLNIQLNPYTHDATPIEETLMQADELGFDIY